MDDFYSDNDYIDPVLNLDDEIVEAQEQYLEGLSTEEIAAAKKTNLQHPVLVSVLYFDGEPLSAATYAYGLSVPLEKVRFADGMAFAEAEVVGRLVVQHVLKKVKKEYPI